MCRHACLGSFVSMSKVSKPSVTGKTISVFPIRGSHLRSIDVLQKAVSSRNHRGAQSITGTPLILEHSRHSWHRKLSSSANYFGIHHVGVLCQNLEKSLEFYQNVLGLESNDERPDNKLPYKGAWLWVGAEMIHLMELPNPDPLSGRPEHGGRDRHVCVVRFLKTTELFIIYDIISEYAEETLLQSVKSVDELENRLKEHNISYTRSKSGRAAIFFRDPDSNVLEMAEQ